MSSIALICQEGLISLFGLVGIDTFGVKSNETEAVLKGVCENKDYLIILITESIASNTLEFINRINLEGKKYIMIIPDHTGKTELSRLILKKAVEKAVGADILRE